MNPADLADATARALDLLDPGDLSNSDPRLLRDPRLAEEARLTREAAADVWLAVSPLHVAPPEVLHGLMEKIHPQESARPRNNSRSPYWLAASGWAAAAALAFFLWPRTPAPGLDATRNRAAEMPTERNAVDPINRPPPRISSREARDRQEIVRVQQRLATVLRDRDRETPRVMTLTAPGSARRSDAEVRQRVRSILTHALWSALEAESATSADPAALVIERGWLPGGLSQPAEGGIIRHRNFPAQAWQEMGLLRSTNGEYLDPASSTLWSADPDGRGFIGRKIAPAEDVSRFTKESNPTETIPPEPRTAPEGFIIENPEENTTDVVIDQVPAPTPGSSHLMLVTDASGLTETIPIASPDPAAIIGDGAFLKGPVPTSTAMAGGFGTLYASGNLTSGYTTFSASNNSSTVFFTLQGTSALGSFQLVERPLIPNGQPDKIVVEGGP